MQLQLFQNVKSLAQVKIEYVREVYKLSGYNKSLTARLLGVTYPTVIRLLGENK